LAVFEDDSRTCFINTFQRACEHDRDSDFFGSIKEKSLVIGAMN